MTGWAFNLLAVPTPYGLHLETVAAQGFQAKSLKEKVLKVVSEQIAAGVILLGDRLQSTPLRQTQKGTAYCLPPYQGGIT